MLDISQLTSYPLPNLPKNLIAKPFSHIIRVFCR